MPPQVNFAESVEENSQSGRENIEFSRQEKLWNPFLDPPVKQAGSSAEETERFDSMVKKIKIVVGIFLFIMILGTSVLSKMTLLFMTSHIGNDRKIPLCEYGVETVIETTISDYQRIAWIWAIVFAYIVPEFGSFLRAVRMCFFRKIKRPKMTEFFIVFFVETLHVVGMALLMIKVLPILDVVQGVMLTSCVCFVPALLSLFSDWHEPKGESSTVFSKFIMPLNVLAICAQLIGFIFWPLFSNATTITKWLIPLAIFLISFHWWENFVSEKSRFSFIVRMNEVKKSLAKTRYAIYVYTSLWKIIVFLLVSFGLSGIEFGLFFTDFSTEWTSHSINTNHAATMQHYKDFSSTVICWMLFTQVLSSYACYIFTKFACKIKIQLLSFGPPINLTVAVSASILLGLCSMRNSNPCEFHGTFPDYLFWKSPNNFADVTYVISIAWILSQAWITRHIWVPKSDKNASTDHLFITPLYNGLIIDQSLSLNRRREDLADIIKKKELKNVNHPEDKVPQIFICATMWHETREEMMEFLKSILRLDEDQSARRLARNYIQTDLDYIDPEYYDLETHIFFDDAFIIDKNKKDDMDETNPINEYVKTLITSISDAAREVHRTEINIHEPQKYVTPYGGRLVWILPGKTKLIAHLKHADKIRKKKRWSQVMYMYYLLGYRIMQLDIPDERKLVISKNTYLLALDGDIDFQPNAVHLLINRMKLDEHLGAACGRIHPIGEGPMVWYQKFEYAIGHWLQKATEHIIGSVLCSPGCFSLFRGRALMENSVMRKYTTNSEEARHFVQYDQGEDRWLCTLLLKQRFRVEYSAASDAYTHSPEGFYEFFNQRRRWVPSTMANILDLLMDANNIVKANDSISMPYIVYQSMLMVGTILGPGTIFLMMIGALVAVFHISLWWSFVLNFVPILIFMILCFRFKQKHQLKYAFCLTAFYAFVMMAVLIGIIIQIINGGATSPTSMFFFAVAAQIVIAGFLHPLEVWCLVHGVIYYITIPSMYMLLVIYSIFNMNDVSWGTRETPKPVEADAPVTEKKGLAAKYFTKGAKEVDSLCSSLFRCCMRPKTSEVQVQLDQLTTQLNETNNQIRQMELKVFDGNVPRESYVVLEPPVLNPSETTSINLSESPTITKDIIIEDLEEENVEETIDILRDWLYDEDLINGELRTLSQGEKKFWIEMIELYLQPLDLDQKQLDDNKEMLKVLRDKSVFAFVMANALFVMIVFMLQLNNDIIFIKWPLGETHRLEPIGFLFVIFFGVILLIQFIAMLMHRYTTMAQILAATDLDCHCGKKPHEISPEIDMRDKAVTIARKLQKPNLEWDEDEDDEEQSTTETRRDTIKIILNQKKNKRQDFSDLERNFKRAFLGADSLKLGNLKLKRKTTQLLEKRRSTVKARQSISQPNGGASNPEGILKNYPRPSLINRGHQMSFTPAYVNESFAPDEDELSLNSDNFANSFPQHRASFGPSNRDSNVPNGDANISVL